MKKLGSPAKWVWNYCSRTYRTVKAFFTEKEGATAAEYALMVLLVALAIIAAVAAFGKRLNTWFEAARDAFG